MNYIMGITELDAVNEIIAGIGEAPIDTLENMTDTDAINAYRLLKTIDRQEQARGWAFNIRRNISLIPDENGHIKFNNMYLYIRPYDKTINLARSGSYYKDLNRNTNVFSRSIKADVIEQVPFEELPDAYRNWVIAKAVYEFNSRYFGDAQVAKDAQMKLLDACQYLQEYEMDINRYNMLENTDVFRLKRRR